MLMQSYNRKKNIKRKPNRKEIVNQDMLQTSVRTNLFSWLQIQDINLKKDEPQLKNNNKNKVYVVEVKHMKNSNVKKYTWPFWKYYLLIQSMLKKIFGIANNKVLLIQFEILQKHKKIT